MDETPPPRSAFTRTLGPTGVMLLTLSALSPVVSVYIGGAGILHLAGTGAALAFLVGGIIPAIIALLYAELGAAFPRAGGTYPTLAGVLGSWAVFPRLILDVVTSPASLAFVALGFADYVRVLAPGVGEIPLAIGAIAAGTAVAVANVRTGALVTGVFLAVEAVALVLLTAVALLHPAQSLTAVLAHPVYLDHGALKPSPPIVMALALVSGAYMCAGASWALYFGEEMKDARRRMGGVIAWAGVIASVTIAGPMVLLVLSIGDVKAVLADDAPVAYFLVHTGGRTVATLVTVGVIAAVFNNIVAGAMAYGRMVYSTGRDRVWPTPVNRMLATLHPRLNSPVIATVLVALASVLACFLGERVLLIFISGDVFSTLLISLGVIAGRRKGLTGRFFRSPLYPLTPLFGLAVWTASVAADLMDPEAGRPSMLLLLALFVCSLLYYLVKLRRAPGGWRVQPLSQEDDETAGEAASA